MSKKIFTLAILLLTACVSSREADDSASIRSSPDVQQAIVQPVIDSTHPGLETIFCSWYVTRRGDTLPASNNHASCPTKPAPE